MSSSRFCKGFASKLLIVGGDKDSSPHTDNLTNNDIVLTEESTNILRVALAMQKKKSSN